MTPPKITTPRGSIEVGPNGKASLTWDTSFKPKWQARYTHSQKFVDSEILRLSEPYIPLLTGTLIKSGILGTQIGEGEVKWIAPYAKAQYYSPRVPGSVTGPNRGPFWFERMKQAHGRKIISDAKKIVGGS